MGQSEEMTHGCPVCGSETEAAYEEYPPRAFCKATCPVQKILDEATNGKMVKDLKDAVCKRHCSARKFHKWLQRGRYVLARIKLGSE